MSMNDEPSKAIRSEVFPDPVGPITILRAPRWKKRSPSIWSEKLRPEGVTVPSLASDQVKIASLNPIVSSVWSSTTSGTSMELVASENVSNNSVCDRCKRLESERESETYSIEEIVYSVQRNLAYDLQSAQSSCGTLTIKPTLNRGGKIMVAIGMQKLRRDGE